MNIPPGLIAAPFTPMHGDGSVALDAVAEQASGLRRHGVVGAFVCGTTGEGLSLSDEERRSLVERWSDQKGDLLLVAHVAHASLRTSCALAEHAAAVGADAIAVMPSSVYGPQDVEGAVRYLEAVAASAPNTPLLYYHIPSVSRLPLSVHTLLGAALPRVDTLVGVKFTHEDLMDYGRCVRDFGSELAILFGRDEILLAGLALGARTAVGSTYNFMAPLYYDIIEAYGRRDTRLTQELQYKAQAIVAALLAFPALAAQKHVMRRLGQTLGPVRWPLVNLTTEQRDALDRQLDALDLVSTVASPAKGD